MIDGFVPSNTFLMFVMVLLLLLLWLNTKWLSNCGLFLVSDGAAAVVVVVVVLEFGNKE
jgi:hypothetical protein